MKKELCKPCAVAMSKRGIKLTQATARTDKITCAECGRRRYGIAYEVDGQQAGKGDAKK